MRGTVIDMLHANVRRSPDAEAMVQGIRRVTYRSLWSTAMALSAFLEERGGEAGERVALLLENSPEYAAACYGVLASGRVVVGLNTASKARDLQNWIRHSGARWLIADGAHAELAALSAGLGDEIQIITVTHGDTSSSEGGLTWRWLVQNYETRTPRLESPALSELAAIIYTSGTTGDPKGVMLSHGNLAANVTSILAYLKLTATDRVLNVLPFYYSYGNSILHTHLAAGACVVLENSLMYPHVVLQKMVAERVTGFSGVPSTYAILLNRVQWQDYDLSRLRYLTQAGGPMPPAQISRMRELIPHATFIVMYGQTEATARIAWLPPERLTEKMGSVGVPIPGVEIDVRNEQDRSVPPGTVGEICVRGANIMLGYWKNHEATARVIRDGWLHTGDLALRDDDGFLFIQGRSSEMIKTGAHRITPKEIEEIIAEVPGVVEAAVAGIQDDVLGEVIHAYVVLTAGSYVSPRVIQAHCRERLAAYKIPKQVLLVDALPKTASGKIKRYALAQLSQRESEDR